MDIISSFAIIIFAAFIHASFQLSVSVLTLLSGHAIGKKTAHMRLVKLTNSYILGVGIMTLLFTTFATFALQTIVVDYAISPVLWAIASGLMVGLGIAIWLFYYRREPGTSLWLPRNMARYLFDRTKVTKHGTESFGLGMVTVIAEFLFIFAPIIAAAIAISSLPLALQLAGVATYTIISLISLLIVGGLIGSGHKISTIQRWREQNKRFLQFASGGGLIVLAAYLYVDQVLAGVMS